jgi:hypothetical protein
MNFKIENVDVRDTLIISAVKTTKPSAYSFLDPEPEKRVNRVVLRPGESEIFNLEEGYVAGIEIL